MADDVVEIIVRSIASRQADCEYGEDICTPPLACDCRIEARAVLAALHWAGFKVLAREPTEAMLSNEGTWAYALDEDALNTWRSMWDAAPRHGGEG